jgi:DnaK suppressor protein
MIDKQMLEELKQTLIDRRGQILSQLEHFEEALADLEQSRPPEFSEEAQEEAAANSLKALDERERTELRDITDALARIAEKRYGLCEHCSGSIGLNRLSALPMVRLCIQCQKLAERHPRS